MTERTGRRRMGWLGWTGLALLALALGFGAWLWRAADTDPAGTLDALDARFARQRGAVLVAKAHYGSDPAQKLALYVPQGALPAGGYPLVVFFHGGGWHSGDPYAYGWIARALAEKGYASALVGYRLNKPGRFPNMLLDSAAGTRWVIEHAGDHRIDVRRAALMGHSAGAYNATMLTLDRHWLSDAGVPAGTVAGAVVLAGPSDFYPFAKKSSINAMSHWPRPQETQPVNYVRADAPPLLLVHGTKDTVVRPRNARILARTMTEAGAPTKAVLFEGMSHNDLILKLARPFDRDRRIADTVFPFLDHVLTAKPSAHAASSPVQRSKG
ncbi:MAG TPA: alpha/beta hydrolase [Novosphingobium sp.]|nr:alpha/beta hydrolase [Novosphingobium sp.]